MFTADKNIRIRVASVIIRDSRVLLVAHRKNDHVYWLLPGGGVAYGETLPAALERELREELGADIEVGDAVFFCDSIEPRKKRHILHIFFSCALKDGELRLGSEKRLYDYRFFTADELEGLTVFPRVNEELTTMLKGENPRGVYRMIRWVPL